MTKNTFRWINCKGKADPQLINFIEKEMGIKMPQTYITLVQECDGGSPQKCDFEYYDESFGEIWGSGIGCFLELNESRYSNLLKVFKHPPEFFPEGLIAFAETGGGDFICFDYRQGKDHPDPPIVYWNHEAEIGKDVSFVASNFSEFLKILKEPEDL